MARRRRIHPHHGPFGPGKPLLVRAGLVLARITTNDPAPVRKSRELAEELAGSDGTGEFDGLQRIPALLPEADVWPLVVVVDQLEELYRLCSAVDVRQARSWPPRPIRF